MAKKSTAARQTSAARRSQTASKVPEVTLVRQPRADNEDVIPAKAAPSGSVPVARPVKNAAVPAPTPKRAPEVTRPTTPPAARPPETVSRSTSRSQVNRVARNQAVQRARSANQLSPRQYTYVKNDLRLIGILAGSMFLVIIILHFLLPIWLPQ